MAFAAKRLYQGQLSAVLTATLATVTTGKTWIVKDIEITNVDSSNHAVTLRMVGSAAGEELFNATSIAAGETLQWTGHIVLASAELITGGADTASKVSVTISGAEG